MNLSLTLNDQEWIKALTFKYHDCVITRVAYQSPELTAAMTEEEKEKHWNSEEPEEPGYPEGTPEEEIKKKEDELAKKAAEETEETNTLAKRRGTKLIIHGTGFMKGQNVMVRLTANGTVHQFVKPVFKNSKKICVVVPDMGSEVEMGNHTLTVETTLNGQQYTNNGITFLYN